MSLPSAARLVTALSTNSTSMSISSIAAITWIVIDR